MKTIEYKIRPVTRFIVTRFEGEDTAGASTTCGEFAREEDAQRVGFALAKNDMEHFRHEAKVKEKVKVKFPDFPDDWSYYPEI